MSNKVLTWIWDNSPAKGADLLLLLALADQANDEGWSWPLKSTLLKRTRISVNTLDRAIARLVDGGQIERVERPGTSNKFRILMPEGTPMVGDPHGGGTPMVGVGGHPHGGGGGHPHGGGTEPSVNPKVEPTLFVVPPESVSETRATGAVAGFDQFWEAYPKKADPGSARKAWDKAIKKVPTPSVIIRAALIYRNDPNREPQYTKNPATWLNAEAWGNDPLPERTGRASDVGRSPWESEAIRD